MLPRIEELKEKKLAGKRMLTSFTNNRTTQLWKSFMPRRKDIKDPVGPALYSVEVYPEGYFAGNHAAGYPSAQFEKWAAMEIHRVSDCPQGMEILVLPNGLYAVFIHKGPASNAVATYTYIFREWLPGAVYELDQRPHFAVMGEKYKHEDDASEEEIWIPVKSRK